MEQEIIKTLWGATENRKACRVILKGEPFPRLIEVYGVCKTSRGKIVVVSKQFAGFTKAGREEGYRNLELHKFVEVVEVLDQKFEFPTDFQPHDPQYGEWVYHILI